MAKLIVTLADNSVTEIEITPRLEYAFELYAKRDFTKRSAMMKSSQMSIG